MIFSFRRILSLAVLAAVCVMARALDLPVKTVNGRQYYYYRANNRESVHGLSKKLGISREMIVAYNPSVADGIKRGAILYFPVEDFAEDDIDTNDTIAADSVAVAEEAAADSVPVIKKAPRALIALPFGLASGADSRQNKHSVDFYKGFMLAADTLADRSGAVEIEAVDLSSAASLPDSAVLRSAVAVLPEDDAVLPPLAGECEAAATYVLNLFNVRDTTYMTNPYMMQANIPAAIMYRKAAEGLMQEYDGYIPVIIRSTTGRNEKEPFTDYLAALCDSLGREYIRIDYDGSLTSSDLAVLENDAARSYVFVPSSGTLAEFNRFAYALRNFRDSRVARVEPEPEPETGAEATPTQRIALFGYPDWIAFRSDAEELLHAMQATIYSRFFDDYDNFTSRIIENEFLRWYGTPMIESVPSQGLLGFDAGCYIIKNIRANNGIFRPEYPFEYRGVQSTFRFERVPGGGFVNTALYIVKYLPAGRLSARVL